MSRQSHDRLPDELKYRIISNGQQQEISAAELERDGGLSKYASEHPQSTIEMHDENGSEYSVPINRAQEMSDEGWMFTMSMEKPTPQQVAIAKVTPAIGKAQLDRSRDALKEDFDNRQQYRLQGGVDNKSVAGGMQYNPVTGHAQQTLIRPSGENVFSLPTANDYKDYSVGAQLREATKRLRELEAKRDNRAVEVDKEWIENNKDNKAPLSLLLARDTYAPKQITDNENRALALAINQTKDLIEKLEDQRDREQGIDVGFWRGFGRTAGDARTWDFGLGDMLDAITMLNADQLIGENATEGEKEAYNEMMRSIYDSQVAGQRYDQNANFWNRAGVMAGYMPSFIVDFVLTGGGFKGINTASKAASKAATKALGKEAIKNMSEMGVKSYIKQFGAKGLGQEVANYTIKALGVTADDLLIRAPLMANTIQAGKTGSAIIENKLGDVTIDDDGSYQFSNDKSWGEAAWQTEADQIIENYSEMVGTYLDPVLSGANIGKLANVFGAKRLSGMLAKADAGALGRISRQTQRIFGQMGLSNYVGEVGEEYYGQLWRTLLGLDSAYQQNPDGTRTNLFATGQFHGDIWGGMALSMGMMDATRHGINASRYAYEKHKVNTADKKAGEIVGNEVWESLRQRIDNTSNEEMGDMFVTMMLDEQLNQEQKEAILDYMEKSMNFRGYNLASMADSRNTEKDPIRQEANESFIHGNDATDATDMQDIKNIYDLQLQQASQQLSPEVIAEIDSNPFNAISALRERGELSQPAIDYINARQAYDGMMQRIEDDINEAIEQNNAIVDKRTNKDTGLLQEATLKVQNDDGTDRRVHIIKGNIALRDDGTIDKDRSDRNIAILDVRTGEEEIVSPDAIFSVESPVDPATEKAIAADAVRQSYTAQAEAKINGIVSFQPGDNYNILTPEGEFMQLQIVPNADGITDNGDGTVNVTSDDGQTIVAMSKDEIQGMVNAANIARVAGRIQPQQQQEQAIQQEEQQQGSVPDYYPGSSITFRDNDGNIVQGVVNAIVPDDNYVLVDIDTPNGLRVVPYKIDHINDNLESIADENGNIIYSRPQEEKRYTLMLSDEVDENGYHFILSSDGTSTFGYITRETGLTPAPIKLSEGFQDKNNKGYGLAHIENRHGKQIRDAGFNSIEEFVENVARNFTVIKRGNERGENETYLLEVQDAHNNTLFIELSQDGSYWNVNSAGVFKKAYSKKKDIVWTLPALGSSTNTDATEVNHGQSKGETVTSGNSPQTIPFDNKDNTNLPQIQEESALSRIPVDENGQPIYEQTDPNTAWDAIVEQAEGNENIAISVVSSMISDKEAQLRKAEQSKPRKGTTIAEKIAAEQERNNAIQQAQAELKHWRDIANVPADRQRAAQAEARRLQDEQARENAARIEQERRAKEEAERIERETLNGVPDMIDDTPADARARGYRRVSGNRVDRQPQNIPSLQGKEVKIKFNDSNIPTGHVAIIDASLLQPSHINGQRNPKHFIDEAQPKERKGDDSTIAASRIASNIRPEEITSSVTAYTGAPTVNTRGEVIQGNNRSTALREMWSNYPEQAAIYRQYLIDNAEEFGMNPQDIAAIQNPVLVNMLDIDDAKAIELGQYVASDTESGGIERIRPKNVIQRMGKDIQKFTSNLLNSTDEEATFAQLIDRNGGDVLKWMNNKGYITPTQYRSAFDSKGTLTDEVKNDLRGIIYQSIFEGTSPQFEEMFNMLPAKAQKAILSTAYRDYDSDNTKRLLNEIQNSVRAYYALSQYEPFVNARNYAEAQASIQAWSNQYLLDDVTGDSYLPAERFNNFNLLLAAMYKGQTQKLMQSTFNNIYDIVQGVKEDNLFETVDNTPRSLADAINETINNFNLAENFKYNGQLRSSILGSNTQTNQSRRQGSDRTPAPRKRTEVGDRTADNTRGTESGGGESIANNNVENSNLNTIFVNENANSNETNAAETGLDNGRTVEGSAQRSPLGESETWCRIARTAEAADAGGIDRTDRTVEEREELEARGIDPTFSKLNFRKELVKNAKANGVWLDDSYLDGKQLIHDRRAKGTSENDVYKNPDGKTLTKLNDLSYVTGTGHTRNLSALLDRIKTHNALFPNVAYEVKGYMNNRHGIPSLVMEQPEIDAERNATQDEIDNYLASIGFTLSGSRTWSNSHPVWSNGVYELFDARPANVLVGKDGTLYFIDTVPHSINYIEQRLGEKVAEAEKQVNTNPTEPQKEAGNYKKGHVKVSSFDITIEQPKGSIRSGVDANGNKWETEMQNTYGYIRGTKGVDGDHIDVFLADNIDGWNGTQVFVIDQYNEDGTFDEHKVMLGFNDETDAFNAYLSNYEKGWKNTRKLIITSSALDNFKEWIDSSNRKTKPYSEYKNVIDKERKKYLAELQDFHDRTASTGRTSVDKEKLEYDNLYLPLKIDDKESPLAVQIFLPDDIFNLGEPRASYAFNPYANPDRSWDYWEAMADKFNAGKDEKSKAFVYGDTGLMLFDTVDHALEFYDFVSNAQQQNNNNQSPIQGLETYSRDEIKSLIRTYIENVMSEAGITAEIAGMEIHGSRNRGDANSASDLDIVVEYKGDVREDDMFNTLNSADEPFKIDDITIDINPIRAEESGTLKDYMAKSREYDKEQTNTKRTDRQGNPIDENGKLIIEKIESIDELTNEDFTNPQRNVQLPAIPKNVDEAIGAGGKPVIIKKNIFEKNAAAHQFPPEESRKILSSALYNPNIIGKTHARARKNYWVAIKIDDKSPLTILEVNDSKDNIEVVGWYTINSRNLERIKRQAEREDGELLILTPEKGAAASLSTLPSNSSSAAKDSNKNPDIQKIEDYGEQIAGARKDILKNLAKNVENTTLQSLISLPFAKAFKRPDLKKAFDEGALREKDVRFAEAVMAATLSRRKPKAGTRKDRYSKWDTGKTQVELWAENAYSGIELLKSLFMSNEVERDAVIERTTANKTYDEDKAKGRQRQLEEWNPGRTFNGTSYPINPVAVFSEVLERLGYEPGSNINIPITGIVPDSSYDRYDLIDSNGNKKYYETPKTFEEVVNSIVYLTKLDNADADTVHPRKFFSFAGREPVYNVTGWVVYEFNNPRSASYKDHTFQTKEDAQRFIEERNKNHSKGYLYLSEPREIREVSKYNKYEAIFINPLTGNRVDTGIEYNSKEEAENSFEKDHDRLDNAVNQKLSDEQSQKKGKTSGKDILEILYYKGENGWKYGVAIADPNARKYPGYYPVFFAEDLSTRKEAEELLKNNREKWETQAKEIREKRQKFVYFDGESQSRAGEDYRNGKNITAEEFANTFGFRGVQFGNWTNQNDRQAALNNAFDAFMDLSRVLNVSPRALSLNGELGIAFGSRGTGNANAHYEPGNIVINLTKTRGAGSLAHEWWHALDNYFSRKGDIPHGYVTADKNVNMRSELRDAFNKIIDNVAKSDFHNRSRKVSSYFGNPIEETARLFGEWVVDEMAQKNSYNHFLSRGIGDAEERYAELNYAFHQMLNEAMGKRSLSFEEFKKTPQAIAGFVYPTRTELAELGKDVRNLFDTVQEKIDEETGNTILHHKSSDITVPSAEEIALRDAVIDKLRESGLEVITDVEVGQRVLDEANGQEIRFNAKQKRALETASVSLNETSSTAISSADGAKIVKNLDALAQKYENRDVKQTKTFIGEVADALEINTEDKSSKYATFEAKNGKRVTIRLSNHNATVSNFDNNGEVDGISIVVTPANNKGILNDGNAHIIEYYYDAIKLRRAEGKPLADIVKSIKQALYSGEYKDATGLAEVEEVNGDRVREHRVYHGSGADFERFNHSHMGEGEGAQAYGWGSYVTEVEGIGRMYAEEQRISEETLEARMADYDLDPSSVSEPDYATREHFGIDEPIELWDGYYIGSADETELARQAATYYKRDINLDNKDEVDSIISELFADMEAYYDNEYIKRKEWYENELRKKINLEVHLYTVEIPDNTGENYLDWVVTIPKANRRRIAEYVRTLPDDILQREKHGPNWLPNGWQTVANTIERESVAAQEIVQKLEDATGSAKTASEILSKAGFSGISYPAQFRTGGRADNARNYVIFNENDLKITDHVRFFKTPNGDSYGFTIGNKIYIEPRIASAETPIHEYTHLWASALRKNNPQEWQNIVGLMKNTPVWEEVTNKYPELQSDDEIADEVLATYSGRRGAQRLRDEIKNAAQSKQSITKKAEIIGAFARIREALRRFWKNVADLFNIHFTNAEEVADRVLSDMLNGVNPVINNIDKINTRFNEQLEQQANGTLPKGHIYQLGRPSNFLRAAGIPDLPIEMPSSQLQLKASSEKHNFNLSEVRNLPEAIANPIATFTYGDSKKSQNILTVLEHGGENFLVGIFIRPKVKGHVLEINSIRNVFPKNGTSIVRWINQGKLTNADKEKLLHFLDQQRTNLADVASVLPEEQVKQGYTEVSYAAKIIKDFENPNIESADENFSRIRYQKSNDNVQYEKSLARDRYEQRVSRGMYQTQEALQDSMLSVREAMDAVLRAEGKKMHVEDIAGFENAYLGENRLSSVNKAEADAFAHTLFKPLLDEVARLSHNEEERMQLMNYMMAKHGLERNKFMAERDAKESFEQEKDKYPNITLDDLIYEYRNRDYAGLTALTESENTAVAETKAMAMVDEYEKNHDVTQLWQRIKAVNDAILSKLYETGMMSKATYDYIKGMYKYYIPLRGFDEKTSAEAYAYLTHKDSAFNAPIKKAIGRTSKADDPLAYMQSMAESAIMQGNRNKLVKQRFFNFVLNHPSDLASINDIWLQYDSVNDEWKPVFPDNINNNDTAEDVERKMQEFEEKMQALKDASPDMYKHGKETVNIPYKVVTNADLHQHQIIVKRNGRDYVITINGNPRAAQAINGQTNPDNDLSGAIGTILKAAEKLNRQLSAFYTTRNPDFVVSNFIRDMLYANSMAWIRESPNYALRFHRNFLRANPAQMKVLFAKLRNNTLDMNDYLENMFYQFIMNGGETGYANIRDIENRKNDIRRELRRANGKLKIGKAVNLLGERLDEYNRAVENCARFAAFMTSREMGRTIDRSIYDAKEASVNFNKKGSGSKFYNSEGQTGIGNIASFISGLGRSSYVFWNAAIQGTTNFGRQAKRHPAKAFTGLAAAFILGALIAELGGDDDDDKNAYYNLPEYVRRSNIMFRAGDSWISIPLPVEYRAVYGLGELMTSTLKGKENLTGGEMANQIASQVSQILPLDLMNDGGLMGLVPSAVKPFAEVMANESWTGLPIYKDTPWNKDMPDWTKAYKSANKEMVGFAEMLNDISGGDEYTKGKIDINPAAIQHILEGYFGGVATTIDRLAQTAEIIAGQREYDPQSILLLNRVVKNGDERTEYRAINNEYFRLKDEHDRLRARVRNYEHDTKEGIFDYAEKLHFLYNSPEYARYEIFEKYRPDIDSLYDELKETVDENDRKEIETLLNEVKRLLVEEANTTRK